MKKNLHFNLNGKKEGKKEERGLKDRIMRTHNSHAGLQAKREYFNQL